MKKAFLIILPLLFSLTSCMTNVLYPQSTDFSHEDDTSFYEHSHNYAYTFKPATEDNVSESIYTCNCGDQIITYGKWCPYTTIRHVSMLLWDSEPKISYDATVYLTMGRSYEDLDKISVLRQMKHYVPEEYKEIRNPDYYIQSAANYYTTYYLYEDNVYLSFTTFLESDEDTNQTWVGLKIETFIN